MIDATPDQVFLDPADNEAWRVMFKGEVLTPSWQSKGAALAYLELLKRREVKP